MVMQLVAATLGEGDGALPSQRETRRGGESPGGLVVQVNGAVAAAHEQIEAEVLPTVMLCCSQTGHGRSCFSKFLTTLSTEADGSDEDDSHAPIDGFSVLGCAPETDDG